MLAPCRWWTSPRFNLNAQIQSPSLRKKWMDWISHTLTQLPWVLMLEALKFGGSLLTMEVHVISCSWDLFWRRESSQAIWSFALRAFLRYRTWSSHRRNNFPSTNYLQMAKWNNWDDGFFSSWTIHRLQWHYQTTFSLSLVLYLKPNIKWSSFLLKMAWTCPQWSNNFQELLIFIFEDHRKGSKPVNPNYQYQG